MQEFDYFYGPEDAEQYQFYRIPKLFITSEMFRDISTDAKLLYGLMKNSLRMDTTVQRVENSQLRMMTWIRWKQ